MKLVSIQNVEETLTHFETLRNLMRNKVKALGGVCNASKRLGLFQPNVSRITNGKYVPKRYETIVKYAKAFGLETFPVETNTTPQTDTKTLIELVSQIESLGFKVALTKAS